MNFRATAITTLTALLLGQPSYADPVFKNLSENLPKHIYDGGWEHFVGGGVAVFDCNNDKLPDVFAVGGENLAILLRNEGGFTFTSSPIPNILGATGAYPIDIDADGLLDLFVLRVGDNRILKGIGDCRFSDATSTFEISPSDAWSTAFTAWWQPGDERPTMAIGNYVDRKDPDGPFQACDNNVILRPSLEAYDTETLQPGFCPLSMLAANDSRGRATLRISNDRHYYVSDGYEQMWDIAEQRFLGEPDGWKNVALWGMGIASRDLNADGLDEVMLTSMGDQVLQFSKPDGGYEAAKYSQGTYAQRPHIGGDGRPSTGWHAEFGDVDNDGLADLFIAKGNVDQMPGMAMRDPNTLLHQNADGTFTEISHLAGLASMDRSRGAAFADFDLDGRLDLIVSNRRAPLEIYRNETPNAGNWIAISLQQDGGNRNAIGSVLTVTTDQNTQIVQHVIGGGHAGGQILPRHFGLKDETSVIVSVLWPDGTRSETELSANKVYVVTKP